MRKIRELLRLKYELGRSHREIATSLGIANSTVSDYVRRASAAGFSWPLPEGLDDAALEAALFPAPPPSRVPRPEPDWVQVHRELQRHKGVSLQLLWLEYRAVHPNGYQYSWFCERYRAWRERLDVVMRQVYRAGEKAFVDYAGPKFPVVDRSTAEVCDAMVFVGVLGASNYTFVDVTRSRSLPAWTMSHVRMFEFWGGVPELVIPDNEKAAVREASRYEPDLNRRTRNWPPTTEPPCCRHGESFCATLECDLLDRSRLPTPADARREVFGFFEGFYNTRPHPLGARLGIAGELRETQPCGLKRRCSAGATEALRASPGCSPSSAMYVASLTGMTREKRNHIRYRQPQKPTVRARGVAPHRHRRPATDSLAFPDDFIDIGTAGINAPSR